MEQHEKNEGIPKRLRLMKKRLKQALALVGILIITLALSGCEKFVETEVSSEETFIQTTIYETAAAKSSKPKEPVEPMGEDPYESPAYPLPDGWTFEKICKLVEINETPIKFPCTIEELENIDEKIKVEKVDEVFNDYNLYYNQENIGTAIFDNASGMCDFIFFNYCDTSTKFLDPIDGIKFAGYNCEQKEEIISFMNNNFNLSFEDSTPLIDGFYTQQYFFKHKNEKLKVTLGFDNVKLRLVIFDLEEVTNE